MGDEKQKKEAENKEKEAENEEDEEQEDEPEEEEEEQKDEAEEEQEVEAEDKAEEEQPEKKQPEKVIKRPAVRKEDEAEEEQPEKVKKRPAASAAVLKRPAASAASAAVYDFGFDLELASAWRRLPRKPKEFTTNFKHDDNAVDAALCTVVFADGMEVTIPGFDVQRVRELKAVHVADRGAEWQGVHEKTGDKLSIVKRADRSPLFCLYSQSSSAKKKQMVCMVKIMHFGDGDVGRDLALKCLTELAEKFAKDKVTTADIYSHREALMEKMGATMPKKAGSRKRTSSSSPKASPTAPAMRRPAAARKPAAQPRLASVESEMDIDVPPMDIMDEATTVLGDMM